MIEVRTMEEAVDLLRLRIEESGLSAGEFARDVLIRDPRTVRRWASGDGPIPRLVVEWLQAPQVAPWPPSTAIAHIRARMQDTGVCDVCGSDQRKEV